MTPEQARRTQRGGGGFWASPEMLRLANKPGHLSLREGGQRLRVLYCDESTRRNMNYASSFVTACYLGHLESVQQMVESGAVPDLTGYETDLRIGYISMTVLGAQRVSAPEGSAGLQHVDVVKYLIGKGASIEQEDIAGYTAVFHSVMNMPRLDIARILLEKGANPNHQNKFGAVALTECLQQNHAASMELLLEFGADPTIADADGCTAGQLFGRAGPQVVAVVNKWQRRKDGEKEQPFEIKACQTCKVDAKKAKLSLCSRCRLVKYCSPACQKADWPTHKVDCRRADQDATITLKPNYDARSDQLRSLPEMVRDQLNIPGYMRGPAARPATHPKQLDTRSNMIIKAQVSLGTGYVPAPGEGNVLVYNRKRTFLCYIRQRDNPEGYKRLVRVIMDKGIPAMPGQPGAKVYLQANLKNPEELVVRIGEVLAAQPF